MKNKTHQKIISVRQSQTNRSLVAVYDVRPENRSGLLFDARISHGNDIQALRKRIADGDAPFAVLRKTRVLRRLEIEYKILLYSVCSVVYG